MADFQQALEITLRNEGGFYVNSKTGEVVNMGITSAFLSAQGLPSSVDDVKALTLEEATGLYREYFWNPIRGDAIVSQEIASRLFDVAVNQGLGTAVREMQRAVNDALADGPTEQVIDVDGVIGPHTLAAMNSIDPIHLLIAFQTRVAERYRTIAAENPELAGDLNGWLTRLYS